MQYQCYINTYAQILSNFAKVILLSFYDIINYIQSVNLINFVRYLFGKKMRSLKSAKIYLCFAVLLLVAKPFLGFSMFNRAHPPASESIFVKAFTKRKQEYTENSKFDIIAIQKKLAQPVNHLFLLYSFLLSIIFPQIFVVGNNYATSHLLLKIKLNLSSFGPAYLLNSQFII